MVFVIHWHESAMGVHVFSILNPPSHLPPHPIPLGCPSAPALNALLHASNLHWSSVSHMVIYMFQGSSLKSSHPHLLPHSPKVCSLHLCLFCYLTYRLIITDFLNSISSVKFSCSSVPALCDLKDCSMPGLPVHRQLLEFTQIHVHWVGDAIQPSHPLSSPSPPAFNLSQNQGLFQGVSSSHHVAKVLECQLQYQSFQWKFRTDFL